MLYGRLIQIGTIYYNKIIDVDGYSYFVAVNKIELPFIKIYTIELDKKTYVYGNSIIVASSNLLSKLIDLDLILSHTPFISNTGIESNKKNYYLEAKQKRAKGNGVTGNGYTMIHQSGFLTFE
jgi:hypothetical protein